jgi:hypothetical protein
MSRRSFSHLHSISSSSIRKSCFNVSSSIIIVVTFSSPYAMCDEENTNSGLSQPHYNAFPQLPK